MSKRSLADFTWAAPQGQQVVDGTSTMTDTGSRPPRVRGRSLQRGGDFLVATDGDFHMATDMVGAQVPLEQDQRALGGLANDQER
jgi:hypothetical protein